MGELNVGQVKDYIQHLRNLIRLEEKADSDHIREELSQQSREKIVADGFLIQKLICIDMDVRFNGKYQLSFNASNHQEIDTGKFKNGSVVRLVDHKNLNEIGRGIIHSISLQSIKVLTDDAPNHLEGLFALMLDADVVTYKRMHFALNKVEASIDKGEKTILNAILKRADLDRCRLEPFKLDQKYILGLNEAQIKVLEDIEKGTALQLVHGPPGTGKTKTLVACIQALVANGDKVLVCSGSNHAVDHIALELLSADVKVVRIGHPARMSEKLHKNTLDELVLSTDIGSVMKSMKQEIDRLFAGRDKRIAKDEWLSRQEYRDERERLSRLKEDLKVYYKNCVDEINKKGHVFCATNTGAGVRDLDQIEFDTVVIDEAGQSITALTLIPLLKAKRILMAGDHLQLPPVIMSQEAIKKGLEITFMEELIGSFKAYTKLLNVQYRMAEPIMGFSNQFFYSNQLVTADSVLKRESQNTFLNSFLKEGPIVFIDTAGADFDEKEDPVTFSRSNEKEATAISLIYKELIENGALVEDIGVITPYRGQSDCIKFHLKEEALPEISTVDSFQGREKAVIIISLTRSNQKKEIGFLSETRRMNVAMTRAQKKLIIMGNSETLCGNDFFDQLMEYFSMHEAYASIWEFPELQS